MEEIEYNTLILENNKEYAEIDTLTNNNNTYIFLSEINNPENICIRKIKIKDNEEYIVGLDTEEEFNTILKLFTEKYTN